MVMGKASKEREEMGVLTAFLNAHKSWRKNIFIY